MIPVSLIKPLSLIGAGALAVLMSVIGIKWYGSNRYEEGYANAVLKAQAAAAKLSEQYRAQEQAVREQVEEEYAKYRGQVLAAQSQSVDLDAAVGRLRKQLATLQSARAAEGPRAGPGTDGASGPDLIGVIAACTGRYDEVVRYAGQIADQLIGLQGYVRAVQPR